MRVLSTVIGSPSHGRAMLPLLSALAAAKHDVLIAAPPQLVPVFAAEPVRIAEVMADSNEHLTRWFRQIEAISPDQPGEWPENLWIETFAGPHFVESWAALLSLARDFGPDLVVRDGGELGGCLVAEALDLPHVSAPSGAANCINPVRLLPELNERRSQLGLPSTDDPYWIYRYGRIDCMPPQYSFTAYPAPTMLNYRQPVVVDRMETLPPWVVELPTDRPLVIAAVGTALQMLARLRSGGMEIPPTIAKMFDATDVLNAIVTGLSKLDCAALVATGGIVVDRTPQDGNVRLVDHFSQPLLLQCAQLFVTHGGYNSIREAVGAGVPMAVAPRFGDQPTNADRVQALGLGRRIFNAGATPHASDVTATCEWLLNNPQITAQTRRAQRQMLTLPPIEAAVADLELLARQTS